MSAVFYYDVTHFKQIKVQLVATDHGLAYVGIRNEQAVSPVFSYYPHKLLVHDAKRLKPYMTQLKEYALGKRQRFTVPLDYSEFGTPFQRRVLDQLRLIPYGTTISYTDVATSLDKSSSVRAVAHAIALNPVLIFVPCHRVILSNGQIGCYRIGTKNKEALIKFERRNRRATD